MIEWIVGVVHLIIVIWAFVEILGSSMSGKNKFLWLLLIILFPVAGLIIYLIFGRKA